MNWVRWHKLAVTSCAQRSIRMQRHSSRRRELRTGDVVLLNFADLHGGVAVTTYGGLGDEFLTKHFNPYYKHARAVAKATGESEWMVARDKERWLERFAAAVCRGNRMLIDGARPRSRA